MKIKEGVIMSGLQIQMRRALKVADLVYKRYGYELVVTSGLDGDHSAGSYHYFGYAVDLRTRDMPPATAVKVCKEIQSELLLPYECILEGDHIHLEYDLDKTKRGV